MSCHDVVHAGEQAGQGGVLQKQATRIEHKGHEQGNRTPHVLCLQGATAAVHACVVDNQPREVCKTQAGKAQHPIHQSME